MTISRRVSAIRRSKNSDKELPKLVPLGTISDAYAFTWANLVLKVGLDFFIKYKIIQSYFKVPYVRWNITLLTQSSASWRFNAT